MTHGALLYTAMSSSYPRAAVSKLPRRTQTAIGFVIPHAGSNPPRTIDICAKPGDHAHPGPLSCERLPANPRLGNILLILTCHSLPDPFAGIWMSLMTVRGMSGRVIRYDSCDLQTCTPRYGLIRSRFKVGAGIDGPVRQRLAPGCK